jgi:PHD/YefM family antitoxin component YafN of YafNO toxin-antitoxin module
LIIVPKIIPIRDLKNTSEISQMCHELDEPIFVTKNGYGDMVIMSMKIYEEKMSMLDVYSKLNAAEEQLAEGKVLDGDASLKSIREKYDV